MPKLKGSERRKQRKQNRKKRDRQSLKERRLSRKQVELMSWAVTKVLTKMKKEGANLKHYCPI